MLEITAVQNHWKIRTRDLDRLVHIILIVIFPLAQFTPQSDIDNTVSNLFRLLIFFFIIKVHKRGPHDGKLYKPFHVHPQNY